MKYELTGNQFNIRRQDEILSLFKDFYAKHAGINDITNGIRKMARDLIDVDAIIKDSEEEYYEKEDMLYVCSKFNMTEDRAQLIARTIDKNKGELFELFAEIFFAIYHADPRYGVREFSFKYDDSYVKDYGVDGYGINANGDNSVVQVKFRSNVTNEIYWNDIAKTVAQGYAIGHLSNRQRDTVWLFTNCKGGYYTIKDAISGMFHCINGKMIDGEVAGNDSFWKSAVEILEGNM